MGNNLLTEFHQEIINLIASRSFSDTFRWSWSSLSLSDFRNSPTTILLSTRDFIASGWRKRRKFIIYNDLLFRVCVSHSPFVWYPVHREEGSKQKTHTALHTAIDRFHVILVILSRTWTRGDKSSRVLLFVWTIGWVLVHFFLYFFLSNPPPSASSSSLADVALPPFLERSLSSLAIDRHHNPNVSLAIIFLIISTSVQLHSPKTIEHVHCCWLSREPIVHCWQRLKQHNIHVALPLEMDACLAGISF